MIILHGLILLHKSRRHDSWICRWVLTTTGAPFITAVILLDMYPPLRLCHKSLATNVTGKLFFPHMSPLDVHILGGQGRERHITKVTFVRFFSGVSPAVGVIAQLLAETLPAEFTSVRLLPGVDAGVLLKVFPRTELLRAVGALEFLLVVNVLQVGG